MQFLIFLAFAVFSMVAYSAEQTAESTFLDSGLIPVNMTALLTANLTDYRPSGIVKMFHGLPHWDSKVQAVGDPVFAVGYAKGTKEYAQSLVGFPVLLFCIGCIALLLLQLGILGYMNWAVPRLGPVEMDETDDSTASIALWTHKVESSRKMWVIYFFVALAIGFFGNHIMFYGDSLYNKGWGTLMGSIHTIEGKIKGIENSANTIKNAFLDVQQDILNCGGDTGTCPQASSDQIKVLIQNEYEALGDIGFKTEVLREALVDGREMLEKYNEKKKVGLWLLYSISLVVLLCFLGCFFTKQSFFMNISIIVAQVIMIGLLVFCTIELMFMMALGDFCMNPTFNVVSALKPRSEVFLTSKYYSECDGALGDGDNFIHRSLATAYEKRTQLGRALMILWVADKYMPPDLPRVGGPICGGSEDVENAFRSLQSLAPQFQNIASSVACTQLHNLWRLTFEVALCSDTMLGVFSLWWAQIITVTGLFLTSIAASIMMLYFDEFWTISATMDAKIKAKHAGDDETDPFAVESDVTDSNAISVGTRSDGYTPVASTAV